MEIKKSFIGGILPGPHIVVLVTSGTEKNSNIMAVSYYGQLTDNIIYIAVRPHRHSNELIRKNKLFGVNLMESSNFKETDLCGLVTGRTNDKFAKTGFKKEIVDDIPLIKESPLSLTCKLMQIVRIGEHDIMIGRVITSLRRKKNADWLLHDEFDYIGKKGPLGKLFDSGKELL